MDGLKLNRRDIEVLASIADYQVLSAKQIAALHRGNVEAVRRRLRLFEAEGLIRVLSRGFGETRGRPERLMALGTAGVSVLRAKGVLRPDAPTGQLLAADIQHLDHQLLLNECRVQLAHIPAICPSLHVRFCSSTSSLLNRCGSELPGIEEHFSREAEDGQAIRFIPDGVFAVTHQPTGRTVHFYLEVDMGTETLASPQRLNQDVRAKILNYQACFRGNHYKRYERIWSCRLRGFRLLLLAYSSDRATDLCRLTKDMPPSDFVWLTDRVSIVNKGVWAAVWAPGGLLNVPRRSILGSLLPDPCPSPAGLPDTIVPAEHSETPSPS